MALLDIHLFGGFRLIPNGECKQTSKIARSAKALLAYLLLFRHRIHSREMLYGIFWADHSDQRAKSCLSTALWRLRRVLEPESIPKGTFLLTTSRGDVGFNCESDYWMDVAEFEEKTQSALSRPPESMTDLDARKLEKANEMVTGELLEGFYEDWALIERERIRSLYLKSLAHLIGFYKYRHSIEKGLACGRKILRHDPLREDIHREMIKFYIKSGQRGMAAKQYKTCAKVLSEELGIQPMAETNALYEQLSVRQPVQAVFSPDSRIGQSPRFGDTTDIDEALQKVHTAMTQFDQMREQLIDAVAHLERLVKK